MLETYDQALVRLRENLLSMFGREHIEPEVKAALRREARCALEIANLPTLREEEGRYRCPECGRYAELNYSPTDRDGFSSVNCRIHGWIGKHPVLNTRGLGL